MLFNSTEFLFTFLPLTVAVFFALGTTSRIWALRWLILASLAFYAWWRPLNVLWQWEQWSHAVVALTLPVRRYHRSRHPHCSWLARRIHR